MRSIFTNKVTNHPLYEYLVLYNYSILIKSTDKLISGQRVGNQKRNCRGYFD
ncbi:hypothetical protein AAJ76_500047165 [Vairimorpha ceranae]|uniref:Uncharacterized protein n=1 Tax=Vairimorpha ceranae TaxID=40302 RepID=A0A0F9ZFT7_9MICR|nr:hypothetical protein AAJ76_500047165 [Vairimorpha ceranae]KKO76229.1 hypothetical protein AAJ76_500047165 [Vairimorpha ceranae]